MTAKCSKGFVIYLLQGTALITPLASAARRRKGMRSLSAVIFRSLRLLVSPKRIKILLGSFWIREPEQTSLDPDSFSRLRLEC